MANPKTNEFEEYVRGLLVCPICSETIKSSPIHQCTNGHVVCADCLTKQGKCLSCRNNSSISTIARNLVFEQIIENFGTSEAEKPELQKCASFSNNLPNAEPNVRVDFQPISDTKELAEHGESKFDEYIKGLLECPVCFETIKLTPIHQCTNGHVVCKDCVTKLDNCPICKSDSRVARNVIFEQIIGNFSAFELTNEETCEEPELQKWGQEFVSLSFSNNEGRSVQINIPPNSGTMEIVEHVRSYNQIILIFKGIIQAAICFYNFLLPICVAIGSWANIVWLILKAIIEGIGYLAIFFAVFLFFTPFYYLCYIVLLKMFGPVRGL